MTNQNDDKRTQNQPSHDAQVQGGQHSHQGAQHGANDANVSQYDQGGSGGQVNKQQGGRGQNPPSHEAQVKGGEHSHSGSQKK